MRISDWSSDVCSSDLKAGHQDPFREVHDLPPRGERQPGAEAVHDVAHRHPNRLAGEHADAESPVYAPAEGESDGADPARQPRHELQDDLLVEEKILSEGDGD